MGLKLGIGRRSTWKDGKKMEADSANWADGYVSVVYDAMLVELTVLVVLGVVCQNGKDLQQKQ